MHDKYVRSLWASARQANQLFFAAKNYNANDMAEQIIFFMTVYEYGQGLVNQQHPEKATYQWLAYEQLFRLGQKAFEKKDIDAVKNIYPTLIEDTDVRVLALVGYKQPKNQVISWMQTAAHVATYDVERLNIATDLAEYTQEWHFYRQIKTKYYQDWCQVDPADNDGPDVEDVINNLEDNLTYELDHSPCPTELWIQFGVFDYFKENLYDNFKGDLRNQAAIDIIETYKQRHEDELLGQAPAIRRELAVGMLHNLN